MDKIQFKNETKKILLSYGFVYHDKRFYLDYTDLLIVVEINKSNYGVCYYIDFGIYIKSRWHDKEIKTKDVCRAEIRSRIGAYEPDNLMLSEYDNIMTEKLHELFDSLQTDGEKHLRELIYKNPDDYIICMPLSERKFWSPIW